MSITARYEGLFDNVGNYTYHILGCGAIGSSAALQLARMGAGYFHLNDRDIVEDVNIGVSQYMQHDLNKAKVDALKNHLLDIKHPNIQRFPFPLYEDRSFLQVPVPVQQSLQK